ncbi:MAG: hypothetical protein ACRCX8_01530 [Sarcina sp.]
MKILGAFKNEEDAKEKCEQENKKTKMQFGNLCYTYEESELIK